MLCYGSWFNSQPPVFFLQAASIRVEWEGFMFVHVWQIRIRICHYNGRFKIIRIMHLHNRNSSIRSMPAKSNIKDFKIKRGQETTGLSVYSTEQTDIRRRLPSVGVAVPDFIRSHVDMNTSTDLQSLNLYKSPWFITVLRLQLALQSNGKLLKILCNCSDRKISVKV